MAAFAALLALALLGAPSPAAPRPIGRYAVWAAHREDAGDLSAWDSVYTSTHETCASAVLTTLIEAHDDGWDVDHIAPPYRAIVGAFPDASPCSATLAVRSPP